MLLRATATSAFEYQSAGILRDSDCIIFASAVDNENLFFPVQ
jgi:hypothetical protein